ncbi:MAG: transcriptional coactivator p15/PC4 family protein [Nanoarchaeota archaeon]|nr:transcriptional coactivator p15/PC4 family protein [Nanoarchaeota archaeon]
MDKEIGKINKGEYQGTVTDIVVGIKEYNGRVGVDIREFTTGERYTGPTKKGLRIPAESFKEFKEMINSINEGDLRADAAAPEELTEDATDKSAENSNEGEEDIPDY